MTLHQIGTQFGKGGHGLTDGTLKDVLTELQGLTVTVVSGAAAGTAMTVAPLRKEDTLLAALVTTDAAAAAMVNDVTNMTIQSTTASGTLTVAGNPVDGETFVLNGTTYAFKTTPTAATDVKITAGNNTTMAAAVAGTVNAYENRLLTNGGGYRAAQVVSTSALGVVTFTAVVDGTAGNSITLTEAASNVTVSGAGTLTGGTNNGSVKSITNLTGKTVTLIWFNKR